ncbi:hypothetical protein [Ciceribacter ferrooxidans]|uniref:Uncharacterized protein n=1 Tax=Ciceribacter ferrooxidans TaxID=2509717 RepID=A0A4Q2TJE8_9HYPH|nr:hypothetical protein [Ciceribacter ferrooxidans]RYC17655.1 hypothetical protein EUU22_06675 [Ciceribacter ferrooxidans]
MITRIVNVLRPVCVVATIALATLFALSFWGIELVTTATFWKLFLTYLVLMIGSTLICFIDNPSRITGR